MFIPAPELNFVQATAERIVAIIEAINSPNVVLPGADSEPTSAAIVGVRNPDASFTVYIHLLQTQSKHVAVYVCDPRAIALAQYPDIESEALQFVESMGFMVDNVNFRRQAPADQNATIERLACFRPPAPAEPAPAAEGIAVPEGLEGLVGLEELETIEPLKELVPVQPVVPAAAVPALSEDDRNRLAKLLAAF